MSVALKVTLIVFACFRAARMIFLTDNWLGKLWDLAWIVWAVVLAVWVFTNVK